MPRLSAPNTPELDDEKSEITRLELERKIVELQKLPAVGLVPLKSGLQLPDGDEITIAHPLGRRAFVWHTPPRGAATTGRIEEIRRDGTDSSKFLILKASGWGATITVDLAVF